MPQAVTHILLPILIVAFFRDFYLKGKDRKNFPLHYVLIAGIGGVLPDIDIALSFLKLIFGMNSWWIHKTFTHSLFFPLVILFLFFITLPINKKAKICNIGRHKLKLNSIFLFLAIGTLIHIILDMIFGDQSYLFYPFSNIDWGFNILKNISLDWGLMMAFLDGILLVIWIVYLELKHKISDFI